MDMESVEEDGMPSMDIDIVMLNSLCEV
jgi:hypothetical protein